MATKKTGMVVGVAAGATAAAAIAAAGAYWLYGSPDAAKHRKSVRSHMLRARAEVLEAVEKMKDVDKQKYLDIVAAVVKRYSTKAGVTAEEIAQMTKDLTGTWQHMYAAHKKSLASAKKAPAKKAARSSKK